MYDLYTWTTPNGRKISIMLEECGLPYRVHPIDIAAGDLVQQIKRIGNNAMLAAVPATGEIRRFFAGPRGQEIAGFGMTPDGRTLFINVQHPGELSERFPLLASTFPDGPPGRGRSCTVIITKDDGGVIGT